MREKKFTPKPWIITEGDEWTHDLHTETETQGKWTVASCNGRRDEVIANKCLISAAPELLEALEESLNLFSELAIALHLPQLEEPMNRVDAAIAKAYGES